MLFCGSPLFVIAIQDAAIAEQAILAFRWLAPPATPIVVRIQDRSHVEKFKAAGASHIVIEYDEISQRLLDSVQSALDLKKLLPVPVKP